MPQVLCCHPGGGLGSAWVGWNYSRVQRWVFTQSPLESSGSDQDREGTCWSLQAQEQPGTTLTSWLCPRPDSCPAPGCSTGRLSRLVRLPSTVIKVWKSLENGSKLRQGIVIFLKMLRELQCASDCDSGDVKILRSLCPVHQDYH